MFRDKLDVNLAMFRDKLDLTVKIKISDLTHKSDLANVQS